MIIINKEQFFIEQINNNYDAKDVEVIKKALEYATKFHINEKRDNGESFVSHPIEVSIKLTELFADATTVVSGLLHHLLDSEKSNEKEIESLFGTEVLNILRGILKVETVKKALTKNIDEADKLREMVLVLNKDARVAFITLADRLHNMETLEVKSREKQIKIASETINLFSPLAERLGMNTFKRSLEDWCFKYLHPERYVETHKYLQDNYKRSEKKTGAIKTTILNLAKKFDIEVQVQSRVKSAYGIFLKVEKKGLSSVYDVIAHRIITKDIKDCYTMLGAVHNLWKPIDGRIKDYIAVPKANMYMSLHTTVWYPTETGDVPVEIQIRTEEMHQICEYGVAAHWVYKEMGSKIKKNATMPNVAVDTKNVNKDNHLDIIKNGFNNERIFVLTPNLNVLELPEHSIPLDFAYALHSNVGNKCIGAKVNGKMVPLTTKLVTGDMIEIITAQNSKGPSRDWLKIVKSNAAKSKIKSYFKKEHREDNIKIGKEMSVLWAKRQGFSLTDVLDYTDLIKEIITRGQFLSLDDLFAAIGYGGISANQAFGKITQKIKEQERKEKAKKNVKKINNKSQVKVDGQADLFSRVANCCNPIPGDEIVGYVSRGRGIVVHRKDCPTLKTFTEQRFVDIDWQTENTNNFYVATIKVYCKNSAGLLAAVSQKISDNKVDISFIATETDKLGEKILSIGVSIKNRNELQDLINKLKQIPDVFDVYR